MISLIISLAVLLIGFLVYGRIVEKVFGPDDRQTPALAINDGVDCVPMKPWKAFLVQLLNIAGTGPIFGALMGACFGPVVFLWIVLGSILGGAVHDYFCGMISSRHEGASIAELSGLYLGPVAKWVMRIFSVVLLVLTGTVFVNSPAALIARLTPSFMNETFWIVVILLYYVAATLLPIDKLIGKLYPVFGIILIVMAVSVLGGIFIGGYTIPELTLQNLHPEGLPVWPYMFVTVACGAISGFHATQSPMIAKCITSEKQGRAVFYGAMIAESVIALIWAAAGVAFYGATDLLNNALSTLGQSGTVYEIANNMLGFFGGALAVVGVVVCPITSGDTAFRSARLILAADYGSAARRRRDPHAAGFQRAVALFLVEQPNACHGCALDDHGVSGEIEKDVDGVADHRLARRLYVGGQSHVYFDGKRGLRLAADRCLSCGRLLCRRAVCGVSCSVGSQSGKRK